MNKKSWEKLPQEGKDYINANWKQYSLDCAKTYDDVIPKFKKEFLATGPGRAINEFTASEFKKMDLMDVPVWKKWIADREKRGPPAEKALDDLYKMMIDEGLKTPSPDMQNSSLFLNYRGWSLGYWQSWRIRERRQHNEQHYYVRWCIIVDRYAVSQDRRGYGEVLV